MAVQPVMLTAFLSASVPDPNRDPEYSRTADQLAIRDAVKALATILLPVGRLVWGGHPSITPLIRVVREALRIEGDDVGEVVLFQSEYFRNEFPPDNTAFERIRVTAAGADEKLSLLRMRTEMLQSEAFTIGIFIGGMEGVEAEWDLFTKLRPSARPYPVASTGGAALRLYELHQRGYELPQDLLTNLAYGSLFRRLLLP